MDEIGNPHADNKVSTKSRRWKATVRWVSKDPSVSHRSPAKNLHFDESQFGGPLHLHACDLETTLNYYSRTLDRDEVYHYASSPTAYKMRSNAKIASITSGVHRISERKTRPYKVCVGPISFEGKGIRE